MHQYFVLQYNSRNSFRIRLLIRAFDKYAITISSVQSNIFYEHVPLVDSSYVQVNVFVLRILFLLLSLFDRELAATPPAKIAAPTITTRGPAGTFT